MPALEKLPPGLKMPSWQLSGYLCRSCTIYAVSPYFLLYVLFAISIRSWIRLSFAVRFDIKMLCHILSQMISMANKPHHLVVWNTTISSCIWFDTILCTYVPRGRKPNVLEILLCMRTWHVVSCPFVTWISPCSLTNCVEVISTSLMQTSSNFKNITILLYWTYVSIVPSFYTSQNI